MFHPLTPKSGFFTNGASGGKPGTPARSPMVRRIDAALSASAMSISPRSAAKPERKSLHR
jgi:hypothetical protein